MDRLITLSLCDWTNATLVHIYNFETYVSLSMYICIYTHVAREAQLCSDLKIGNKLTHIADFDSHTRMP